MALTQPHPESFTFPFRMTRRQALKAAGCGFGYLALAGLASSEAAAALNPLAPKMPHFPPKARRAIFLFMQGGSATSIPSTTSRA